MAGMISVKGGSKTVAAPKAADSGFVLGSRPAVLRAPTLGRAPASGGGIKPGAASTRNYAKPAPTQPFGNLGGGNTNMSGTS